MSLNDLLPTTPDLRQERLDELRRLFPDLFTNEGRLDPDELKRLVAPNEIHETDEVVHYNCRSPMKCSLFSRVAGKGSGRDYPIPQKRMHASLPYGHHAMVHDLEKKLIIAASPKDPGAPVYWFCNLRDAREANALHHLQELLRMSGVQFYVRSVGRKPDRDLEALIHDF